MSISGSTEINNATSVTGRPSQAAQSVRRKLHHHRHRQRRGTNGDNTDQRRNPHRVQRVMPTVGATITASIAGYKPAQPSDQWSHRKRRRNWRWIQEHQTTRLCFHIQWDRRSTGTAGKANVSTGHTLRKYFSGLTPLCPAEGHALQT